MILTFFSIASSIAAYTETLVPAPLESSALMEIISASGFLSSGQKIEDFLNEDLIYSPDYEGKDEDANSFSDLTYNIDNFINLQYGSLASYFGKIDKPSGSLSDDYEVLKRW